MSSSKCCQANITAAENCCCKICAGGEQTCFFKKVHGLCRMDAPCMKFPRPRTYSFYQDYKNHKNPDLPWLDWHYRPMITYDSTDVNYFHHQLKRRVPGVGDVYYHDLHEDLHQHK